MTKIEQKKHINKSVYAFVEALGYQISDDNDGSYVTFSKPDCDHYDDTIDYSRSNHETCVLNWASDEIKADAEKIDAYALEQVNKYKV